VVASRSEGEEAALGEGGGGMKDVRGGSRPPEAGPLTKASIRNGQAGRLRELVCGKPTWCSWPFHRPEKKVDGGPRNPGK